jgi:hypothetical protein
LLQVAVSQSVHKTQHQTAYIATGPITFTFDQVNTLFNGWTCTIYVIAGTVTLTPNGVDTFQRQSSGSSLTVGPGKVVSITVDGANPGNLYAEVQPIAPYFNSVQKTTSYTVANSDKGNRLILTGNAYYTVFLNAASSYDSDFSVDLTNPDSRGKLISPSGLTPFILWPGQTCTILNGGAGAWEINPLFQRWGPTTAVTFNVSPSGSDSNDGLATGTGAFATIQHAFNVLQALVDVSSGTPTIQCADGTYNVGSGIVFTYAMTGGKQLFLTGDVGSPGSCRLNCNAGGVCLFGQDGTGTCTVTGFDFATVGNGSIGINTTQFYQIDFGSVQFDSFPLGSHIVIGDLGSMDIAGNYTIAGNATTHIVLQGQAKINYGTFTVNLPSGLAFTQFLSVADLSWLNAGGLAVTFTGPGAGAGSTGQKYNVTANSVVASSGTTFPGTVAGTTGSGGLFS